MEGSWARFDYLSPDVDAAVAFYTSLFGWTTRRIDAFTQLLANNEAIGGIVPTPDGAPPSGHWFPHLATADVAATSARVTSLGGKVVRPAQDNGELGKLAIITDPIGASFALWQPATKEISKSQVFVWNELSTPDPAASISFYAALCGYSAQTMQMPDGTTYHVLERDGRSHAGVMKPPAPDGKNLPMPQAWMPYVLVASCDETIDKAKQLGAHVHVAANVVPGVGRIGIFSDPLGGMLGVLQP